MKKTGRIIAIIMVAVLLMIVAACGGDTSNQTTGNGDNGGNTSTGDNNTGDSGGQANSNDSENANDTGNQDASGDQSQPGNTASGLPTVEEGMLIMGTNAEFPPYEFWEGGRIVGIDAEIAEAIANKLNLTLRIDDMEFGSIIAAVSAGRIDMGMAGMTVTEERMESVNFSTSYATGVQVIIVRDGSPITSVDDLFDIGGFDIGVQESTTGDLYTTWDLEEEGLATIHRYARGVDAVMALLAGRVDCVVIDNQPAIAFVAVNDGLLILETEFAVEDYAIALAKGNIELRDAVDAALRELIADGTVQAIIDRYITSD